MEDDASQLKRKAIRALMSDKSLDPAERTKQIQLIMAGKVKLGGTPTQQHGSAAAATSAASSTTASKSHENSDTDGQHLTNEQLKRKAIRELMSNKSLTPSERTKQVQLIMSGKQVVTSAASQSPAPFKSEENTGEGEDNLGAGTKKSPPLQSASNDSYDEKIRAKMSAANNINNNNDRRASAESSGSGAMDDFEACVRNKAASEDIKTSVVTQSSSSQFDERLRSKLANSTTTNEAPSSSRRSSNISSGSGAMDEFEARVRSKAESGDTKEPGARHSSNLDDRLSAKLAAKNSSSVGNRSIESTGSTVDAGTIGSSTVELGTLGGDGDTIGSSTVELGTLGNDGDSTFDAGTIGDESDISSLASKSSITSRNWGDRVRAAALEAKIAAKMGKKEPPEGSFKDPSFLEVETNNRSSVGDESDAEYTFDTTSCFTLELQEEQPSSSHGGVGYGSMPMPEEHFPGDETFRNSRESSVYSGEGIEEEPQFSLTGEGQDSGTPNGTNTDGLAVARAVAPDDEPDFVYAAVEYDPDAKPPLHKNRRFRLYTYFALFLIVVVVALVVVYITSITEETVVDEKIVRLTSSPTPKPTSAPTTMREAQGLIEQLQEGVLLRNENFDAMRATDPRRMALDWILHKDDQRLVSDSINLYQRYGLAVLAYSMDSKAWKVCGDPGVNFTDTSCSVFSQALNETRDFGVWLSGAPECTWYGVTCSADGIVRAVELINNNLAGVLPHELTALSFLQILALAGNCLYGTIPSEFGQLDHLLSLELHENGLSGEMPPTIYQLEKLQLLNLARQYGVDRVCEQSNGTKVYTNFKHGGFARPAEFSVGLTGKLGSDIGKWKSMKGMYLFENSFSGEFTDDIGSLRYLTKLHVNDNFIEGGIPSAITNLKNLRDLRLDDNFLYSSLPESIGNMEDLEILFVNGNSMYGKIPDELYALKKLKSLFLHDTIEANSPWLITDQEGFSGTINSNVGGLTNLEYLLLNNNPISGFIPPELGNCTKLKVLRLHRTNLIGTMPRQICMLRDKNLNSEDGVGVLYADCRPDNKTNPPRVDCNCCSDCCDHSSNVCVQDD